MRKFVGRKVFSGKKCFDRRVLEFIFIVLQSISF